MKLTENKEFMAEFEALIEKYTQPFNYQSAQIISKDFADLGINESHSNIDLDNTNGTNTPKFKIGDWITNGEYTWLIEGMHNSFYDIVSSEGCKTDDTICHIDKHFRLFTIQDAKDGDVLNSLSHKLIWIFKDKEHYHACVNMNYVTQNVATNGLIKIPEDACPATKDEQTILFALIEKSDYEWDADNMNLKEKFTRWRDDKNASMMGFQLCMDGKLYYTDEICFNDKYAFDTKAQAKSALAMARISQIMANDERFGGVVTDAEWKNCDIKKYAIERVESDIEINSFVSIYHFLAFHSAEQRDTFLNENYDLVCDFLMVKNDRV